MIESLPLPGIVSRPPGRMAPERGIAASAADPLVLFEIARPELNLAVWHRPLPADLPGSLAPLMHRAPFCHTAEGTPEEVVDTLAAATHPFATLGLLLDIQRLALLFAGLIGSEHIGLRLEGITGKACHRWHADAVGLRLLTTYQGPGTEWLCLAGGRETARGLAAARPATAAAMPAGAVAILKGEAYPANEGWGCIHRSPPAGPRDRARLLLCLDEPGRLPPA